MIRQKYLLTLLFSFSLFSGTVSSVSLEELFEAPYISSISISPTGDYFAIKIFEDGKHILRFLDRNTMEVTGGLRFSGSNEVGGYFWANDERVVVEVYEVGKTQEAPQFFGELYAINFDGSKNEFIFGYRSGEKSTGSFMKHKTADYAWGEIIDVLPENKKNILISSTPMTKDRSAVPSAQMLDIYSGRDRSRKKIASHPSGKFLTDSDGEVRIVSSVTLDGDEHVEGLPVDSKDWIEFTKGQYGDRFTPIAITGDSKSVYVFNNAVSDKRGLYKLSLDGENFEKVYVNDLVDITDVTLSTDGKNVYAIRVDKDYASYLLLSKTLDEANIFRKLLQNFQGKTLDITSSSEDGNYWVVYSSSDTDPGSFHLYDKKENALSLLFRSRPSVNSENLAPMEPIEFSAADGRKISGYFTKAINTTDDTAPMIVLVHGGPRARDYWGYNGVVQALATRGYSVLQVNFRGSTGYGNDFLHVGDHHWGDEVQQDIISGTQWAIAEGRAKKNKVCIMGSSFGAYSAIQSSILAPDLYSCAVANAGIYDLELMYKKGDIEEFYWGDDYLEEVIGRDKKTLKQFSPVNHVEKLKIPVFIAHGKRDQRAPYEHAKRLKKALDKHDKEYVWKIEKREAHGFYDSENRVTLMKDVLIFLDKNLK